MKQTNALSRLGRLLPIALTSIALGACATPNVPLPDAEALARTPAPVTANLDLKAEPASASGNPVDYKVFGKRYQVIDSSANYRQRGLASWYGKKFHGRKTSSGEKYDMYQVSAAHKTLPIPTYARVTRLDNGQSLVVRINDRGPFVHDRIIDLSYGAAQKLGMVKLGTVPVEVVTLPPYQYLRGARPDEPVIAAADTPVQSPPSTTVAPLQPTRSPPPDADVAETVAAASPTAPAALEALPTVPAQPTRQATMPVDAPVLAAVPQEVSPVQRRVADTPASTPAGKPSRLEPIADPAAAPIATNSFVSLKPAEKVIDHEPGAYLQIAAFNARDRAEVLQSKLSQHIDHGVSVAPGKDGIFRVRVGPIESAPEHVDNVKSRLSELGFGESYVVRHD